MFYKSGPKECCKRAVQTNALNTPFYENVAGILHKGSHEEVFCKRLSTKAERRVVERSKQDTPGSTNCFWPPQGRILRTLSTIELEIEKVSHWVACGQSYSLYQLYPYCKWAALLLTLDYIIQVTLPLFAPPCSHHLPSQG